jgi:8-oxo-dGTP pyrophosphatase MutT (NUDIX family)
MWATLYMMKAEMTDTPAPAASVILLRHGRDGVQVLLGQRGAAAAFMPSKFVFPGGRVDGADHAAPMPGLLDKTCTAALGAHVRPSCPAPDVLTAAALRELREETGLVLNAKRTGALRFVFRAITPKGRPRRFDARFFLGDMGDFTGDCEGFSAASDELSCLQWLPLSRATTLDLPFITRVILAEVAQSTLCGSTCAGVPFFDNSGAMPAFSRL